MSVVSNIIYTVTGRRVAKGGAMGVIAPPPNSESRTSNFQVNQDFGVQAKAIRQCKSRKLLKEPILLQLLDEPDQSSMVY